MAIFDAFITIFFWTEASKCRSCSICRKDNNINNNKEDRFIKAVYKREKFKGIHSIFKAAERFAKELKAPQGQEKQSKPTTKKVKRIKQLVRNDLQKQLKETWKNKVMHGTCPESLEKADVDRDQTNIWLKNSGLKPETE